MPKLRSFVLVHLLVHWNLPLVRRVANEPAGVNRHAMKTRDDGIKRAMTCDARGLRRGTAKRFKAIANDDEPVTSDNASCESVDAVIDLTDASPIVRTKRKSYEKSQSDTNQSVVAVQSSTSTPLIGSTITDGQLGV